MPAGGTVRGGGGGCEEGRGVWDYSGVSGHITGRLVGPFSVMGMWGKAQPWGAEAVLSAGGAELGCFGGGKGKPLPARPHCLCPGPDVGHLPQENCSSCSIVFPACPCSSPSSSTSVEFILRRYNSSSCLCSALEPLMAPCCHLDKVQTPGLG